MPEAFRPASKAFNVLLHLTLVNWLRLRFQPRIDAAALADVRPPYLLVGNHSCNWDAFFMGIPVHAPIHYVASDEYFRTPFLRFLFHLIGGIPKTKNLSDSGTIRAMLAAKKAGGILGLYPEGNRNWDGVTTPLIAPTAKLVKKFRIPVLSVVTTGNMLLQPRWCRYARSGPVFVDFRLLFTPEDCDTLTEEEIAVKLAAALAHDDHPDAEARAARAGLPFRYKGKRLAERLERFLFQCPSCGRADTLSSSEDLLRCTSCGMTVRYGEDGRLSHAAPTAPEPFIFPLARDWNRWQCGNLSDAIRKQIPYQPGETDTTDAKRTENPIRSAEVDSADPVLLVNSGAFLKTGGRTGKLADSGSGTLQLHADRLLFIPAPTAGAAPMQAGSRSLTTQTAPDSGTPLVFPLSSVTGLNIQYNDKLEFYRDSTLFRISFPNTTLSVWKWHQAVLFAQEASSRQHAGGRRRVSGASDPRGGTHE